MPKAGQHFLAKHCLALAVCACLPLVQEAHCLGLALVEADLDSGLGALEGLVDSKHLMAERLAFLEVGEQALVSMPVEVVQAMLLVVDLVRATDWVVGAVRQVLQLVGVAPELSGWLALVLISEGRQLVGEHP